MNCATTIERKPDALLPSAHIPFIPHTERKDMLKTYGDAPDTVSVSIVAVAPVALGLYGIFGLIFSIKYVNVVSLITPWTFDETL